MAVIVFWSVLFVCIAVAFYLKHFFRLRKSDEPELVKGNWLLGSCIEFSMNAVSFLQSCCKRHGKVYTIRFLNQHITMIMDPHSYDAMSKTKTFDFHEISSQVNNNVFGCVIEETPYLIKETAKTVRGPALTKEMTNFSSHLSGYIDKFMDKIKEDKGWHTMGLREFTSKTAFNAIFDTVFGAPNGHPFNGEAIYPNFETYHKFFNFLWLGLPRKMFPQATKALENMLCIPKSDELIQREDLSGYIKTALNFMKSRGQTEADMIGHNLIYLHVNYNTFRLLYWAVVYTYSTEKALAALREEIQQLVKRKREEGEDEEAVFTREDVEKMDVLNSIMKESFRMASGVFMIRYVTEDTQFTTLSDNKTYTIRKGDRVAIYPPAIHHDPEIFDNHLEFQYDRFVNGKQFYKDGQPLKHPIMPFGSRCTGQKLAVAQIKCYLLTIVNSMDMEMEGELPEFDTRYYGHEILPPVNDVQVRLKLREGASTITYQA